MKAATIKCMKICCLTTIILLVLIILTMVILYFTILKPKQPIVDAAVKLKRFEVGFIPIVTLHIILGADIFIRNRNYAGFKYHNSTTSLYYKSIYLGEAPISAGEIKARSTQNVSTIIDLQPIHALSDPGFVSDLKNGTVVFTSGSVMVGDVILLKYLKLHATTKVHCDITVFVDSKNSVADCFTTAKF